MSDGCDPIIEAGDDGEVLDRSADGAIECVADGEEERLNRQRERERRERRESAPAWRRAKWWLFSRSDGETAD